jgi:hypothetical protein
MPRPSFLAFLPILLLLSGSLTGCVATTDTMIETTQTTNPSFGAQDQTNFQLLPLDGGSFYYYAGGDRIPLRPSLQWIAVKFASAEAAEQSAALEDSIVEAQAQAQELPTPGWVLLPVRESTTAQALIEGINSLRADRPAFRQVNPVFQTDDAMMIVTDQFIATFPAEQAKEDTEAINASHDVEIVEPLSGLANTYVLQVTDEAGMDALSMANLYQESGLAVDAAPNFIRIVQK